jgi:hypothetical protein
MSLLTMCQAVTGETGFDRPSSIATSSDPLGRQLLALANREGKYLATQHDWTALQTEATFTTLAAELQGTVETIAPGFGRLINDTAFNRGLRVRILGPYSPADWQWLKAIQIGGTYSGLRIKAGSIYLIPQPAAGLTVAFEHVSRFWCSKSDGTTPAAAWALDSDIGIIDETLMQLGLMWRFKKEKGLDWGPDNAEYQGRVLDAAAADGGKPVLTQAPSDVYDPQRSIIVPDVI